MTSGNILIVDAESPVARKLIEHKISQGASIAAAVSNNTQNTRRAEEGLSFIQWNRSSLFSTKMMLREAFSVLGTINEFVIFHAPVNEGEALKNVSTANIQKATNGFVGGFLYLLREIIASLSENALDTPPTLLFVLCDSSYPSNPVEAAISGAFSEGVKAILRDDKIHFFKVGFHLLETARPERFIRRLDAMEEKGFTKYDGNWITFPAPFSFLNRKQ